LKLSDGLPELLAFQGESGGDVDGASHLADGVGRHSDASGVKRAHCRPKAAAFNAADDLSRRHTNAVKMHIADCASVLAHFLLGFADAQASRLPLHNEG